MGFGLLLIRKKHNFVTNDIGAQGLWEAGMNRTIYQISRYTVAVTCKYIFTLAAITHIVVPFPMCLFTTSLNVYLHSLLRKWGAWIFLLSVDNSWVCINVSGLSIWYSQQLGGWRLLTDGRLLWKYLDLTWL